MDERPFLETTLRRPIGCHLIAETGEEINVILVADAGKSGNRNKSKHVARSAALIARSIEEHIAVVGAIQAPAECAQGRNIRCCFAAIGRGVELKSVQGNQRRLAIGLVDVEQDLEISRSVD